MAATASTSNRVPRVALAAAGLAAAVLLGGLSIGINMKRACVTQDTPYLDLCPALPGGSAAELAALRSRIAANPGDSNAYVQLALADRSTAGETLVGAAARLSPNEPNVVALQAAAALNRQDWANAVGPLVHLVEYRDTPQAAQVLARLVAAGQGQLLLPYVQSGRQWVARTLAQMPQAQSTFTTALPLIVEALKVGILDADTVRGYVRQLKAANAWADAYGLWLAMHGTSLPVLYNAGFEQAFQPDGFDWEVTAQGPASKSGAIIERKGAEARGGTLDIRFTGRALKVPLVRQLLFLGEGRYRLRGGYMARQLRMEQGLAWAARCSATPQVAGRSQPLGDTGGAWQRFDFEFSVPPGCGLVTSLQLETYAAFEAALGARGRVAFDAFSLEKLAP